MIFLGEISKMRAFSERADVGIDPYMDPCKPVQENRFLTNKTDRILSRKCVKKDAVCTVSEALALPM